MDSRQIDFLQFALGEPGTSALQKAEERDRRISCAIVPRALLGWISVASRLGFTGTLPGAGPMHLEKSERGYSGSVSLDGKVYSFRDSSLFQVGAAVAVSLGIDDMSIDQSLPTSTFQRLGKSIDALVKARAATDALQRSAASMSKQEAADRRRLAKGLFSAIKPSTSRSAGDASSMKSIIGAIPPKPPPGAAPTAGQGVTQSAPTPIKPPGAAGAFKSPSTGDVASRKAIFAAIPPKPAPVGGPTIAAPNPTVAAGPKAMANPASPTAVEKGEEGLDHKTCPECSHTGKPTGGKDIPYCGNCGARMWTGAAPTKKTELPGETAKPKKQLEPMQPTAPSTEQVKDPTLPKAPKPKVLKITKSESSAKCPMCSRPQFFGDVFRGCYCFREFQKSVAVQKSQTGYTLVLDPSQWDEDGAAALLQSMRRP